MSDDKAIDRLMSLMSDRKRPFMLKERNAHVVIDALRMWADHYKNISPPQETGEDADSDAEALMEVYELQRDLYEWLGYNPAKFRDKPRRE